MNVGLNDTNNGFSTSILEQNETITLLYCSFSSHGLVRRTDHLNHIPVLKRLSDGYSGEKPFQVYPRQYPI